MNLICDINNNNINDENECNNGDVDDDCDNNENYTSNSQSFVDENEDLEVAAKRELQEETQIKINHLEQLKAFGKPYRDPRSHRS